MRLSSVEPIIAMAFCIHKMIRTCVRRTEIFSRLPEPTDNFLSTKIRHLSIILPSLYKSAGNLSPSISNPQSKNSAIMKEVGLTAKHDFVFIKSEYKIVKVNFDDILFCKGMKDYIQIYLNGKSNPIVTLKSLNAFEAKLPTDKFIRVHRSYIVSLQHVDSISKNEISIGKQTVPIGNICKPDFFHLVDQNS